MTTFLKSTLPLVLVASALSGVAGYAYGIHFSQRSVDGPARQATATSAAVVAGGDDVLSHPQSWRRWPQLTDF